MILWCCVDRINRKQNLIEQIQWDDVTLLYVGCFVKTSTSVLLDVNLKTVILLSPELVYSWR